MNDSNSAPQMLQRLCAAGFSHSQALIWLGQSLHPSSPLYNMAFNYVLDGAVDVERLQQAFGGLVSRHASLRTYVEATADGDVLREHPAGWSVGFDCVDLSDAADPDAACLQATAARAAEPLPWRDRLLDSAIYRLAPDRHVWYFNQHHLVTDAWTCRLLVTELFERYDDPQQTWPELVAKGTEASADRHHAYWEQVYQRISAAPGLYGNAIVGRSTRSTRCALTLDEEQTKRLSDIAAAEFPAFSKDQSLFVALSVLLIAWLHRASSREIVGFETPMLNRPDADSKQIAGLFIEMYPLAVSVGQGDSFAELGQKVREQLGGFMKHAVTGSSIPTASQGCDAVLNVIPFAFCEERNATPRVNTIHWLSSGHIDAAHGVRLQACHLTANTRLDLLFDFNDVVFSEDIRDTAVGHFERLLTAFIDDPRKAVDAVPILSAAEEQRLVIDFNATQRIDTPRMSVVQRLAEQVRQSPDKIAIEGQERQLSYAELDAQTKRLASGLRHLGIKPGDRVGVGMRRSVDALLMLIATMRMGASFVAVDAKLPRIRREHIVASAEIALLIADAADEAAQTGPGVITSAVFADVLDAADKASPSEDFAGVELDGAPLSELAYVLFTSGSTGRPKGVPISHLGLANYLEWAEHHYVPGGSSNRPLVFAFYSSMSFDLTITSMFLPLICGGTVLVYEDDGGAVDSALFRVFEDNRASAIKVTPSHLKLLQRMDLQHSRLDTVIIGGERLTQNLATNVMQRLGENVALFNEYGPTETVVGCMIERCVKNAAAEDVPIGRPADNTRVYALNPAGLPVPAGVRGELHVHRLGQASQYLGADAAANTAFVPDLMDPTVLMYKTGDLGYFDDNGRLVYAGRKDEQVKVQGHRLELSEVENCLLEHPAVAECAVLLQADQNNEAGAGAQCCECGAGDDTPGILLDDAGRCNLCRDFRDCEDRINEYFRPRSELRKVVARHAKRKTGKYDCMVLLSGGKDSTYALYNMAAMGFRLYVLTLDNGYVSPEARANIERVVADLDVEHEFATTSAMAEIFRDSLDRFSNVCQGCFKTLYTLSINRAHELGIPIIVTGLSRGQLFETRLNMGLFKSSRFSNAAIDGAVRDARVAYHRRPDAVTACLDNSLFASDGVFDEIELLDFYRYWSAPLEDMLAFLNEQTPWRRPADTGRSSNCLINDVGIYVHQLERGFHNYAIPYSWDVRLDQKRRDEAIEELHDDIDINRVRNILDDVGYQPKPRQALERESLAAFYVVANDRSLDAGELREHLADSLPSWAVPTHLISLEALPVTANGKLDRARLLPLVATRQRATDYRAPDTEAEIALAGLWGEVLGEAQIGADDSFFDLGGTSLEAIDLMTRLCDRFDVQLPLPLPFDVPVLHAMAEKLEVALLEQIGVLSDAEIERQLDELR